MIALFKIFPEKKLIGKRMTMCLADNKTHALWYSFMPRRKEIKNNIGTDLYSMQVYDEALNFKTLISIKMGNHRSGRF